MSNFPGLGVFVCQQMQITAPDRPFNSQENVFIFSMVTMLRLGTLTNGRTKCHARHERFVIRKYKQQPCGMLAGMRMFMNHLVRSRVPELWYNRPHDPSEQPDRLQKIQAQNSRESEETVPISVENILQMKKEILSPDIPVLILPMDVAEAFLFLLKYTNDDHGGIGPVLSLLEETFDSCLIRAKRRKLLCFMQSPSFEAKTK
jgi:hypothetical protein